MTLFRRLTTAMCLALASPLWAQSPIDQVLSHRVIEGWMESDGSYVAGLELTLAPGWKTYWRSPGDAGIPPEFDWRRARNLGDVAIEWPTPTVFWQSGMRSVGYQDRVVLPLRLTPKRDGRSIHLRGEMTLGICADVCVPAEITIDTTLPPAAYTKTPSIVSALAALPYSEREAGVASARCHFTPTEDGMRVRAEIDMPSSGGTEQAVIETADPHIWVSEPETRRSGDRLTVSAEMMHSTDAITHIDRSGLRITVIGGSYAVDIKGCSG